MQTFSAFLLKKPDLATEQFSEKVFRSHVYRGYTAADEGAYRRASYHDQEVLLQSTQVPTEPWESADPQIHHSDDGRYTAVVSAFLTNHSILVELLMPSSTSWQSVSAGELVLQAWLLWGKKMVSRLEGSFSLCIWDSLERRLFVARDPLGYRPFFVAEGPWGWACSTTLGALLEIPGFDRSLNMNALAGHLIKARRDAVGSAYKHVEIFPGGHLGEYHEKSGFKSESYWRPELPELKSFRTQTEAEETFAREFDRATEAFLPSTGEAGILLSGGLDSAAVTASLAGHLARQGRELHIFHTLPDTSDRRHAHNRVVDESAYVRKMERFIPNGRFHFRRRQLSSVPSLEEWSQYPDSFLVPGHGVFSNPDGRDADIFVDLGIKSLSNGLGGNYIVSWESQPKAYLSWLLSRGQFIRLIREIQGAHKVYDRSRKASISEALKGLFVNESPTFHHSSLHRDYFPLLKNEAIERFDVASIIDAHDKAVNPFSGANLREGLIAELADLMRQNIGVEAEGLRLHPHQIRSDAPMFDLRLNSFCLSLNPSHSVNNGWDRLLLRKAMVGRLPDEVVWRKDRGFPQPGIRRSFLHFKSSSDVYFEEFLEEHSGNDLVACDVLHRYWKSLPPDDDSWHLMHPSLRALNLLMFLSLNA